MPPIKISRPPAGKLVGGLSGLSAFFRPTLEWAATVAEKAKWPEFYQRFHDVLEAERSRAAFVNEWLKKLASSGLPKRSRPELSLYIETPAEHRTPELAQRLGLSAEDVRLADWLRSEWYNPLGQEFNIPPEMWLEDYLPHLRKYGLKGARQPMGRLTKTHVDFFAEHVREGMVGEREMDPLKLATAYLRMGARKKYMGEPLEALGRLNNMRTSTGEYVTGSLQPIIRRFVHFMRGEPDHSQLILSRALEGVINTYNSIAEKSPLPLPKLDTSAAQLLNRVTLYTYAGALGMRLMVPIRDSLQFFVTSLPILRSYALTGLKESFGVLNKEQAAALWERAKRAGWIYEHPMLRAAYAPELEQAVTGLSEKMLYGLQISNTSNRLITGLGASAKAFDALKKYALRGEWEKFRIESGIFWLNEPEQRLLMAAAQRTPPAQWQQLADEIAKNIVDLTQWNYVRGATPGIYRYAVGRLFGQYGTWPLSYVEFARRVASRARTPEGLLAFATLAAAHAAILEAGDALGIDTASWVFTQPASYAGGPLTTGAMSLLPAATDWDSWRGAVARRELERLPSIFVPGGLWARTVYEALASDDPNLWLRILGFTPLEPKEGRKGLHALVD